MMCVTERPGTWAATRAWFDPMMPAPTMASLSMEHMAHCGDVSDLESARAENDSLSWLVSYARFLETAPAPSESSSSGGCGPGAGRRPGVGGHTPPPRNTTTPA